MADCGRTPNSPMFMFSEAAKLHTNSNRVINSLDDYLHQMTNLWASAREALKIAQHNKKLDYDAKHIHAEFKVGEQVYLSTQRQGDYGQIRYASQSQSSKFEPRYLGPFKIINKVSSHAYKLELPPSIKIHPVIHIRYLIKPRETLKYPNRIVYKRPTPVIVDEEPEYEVESILKRRVRKIGKGARVEFLVHWKGYPSEEDTWEPKSNLTHCREILKEFYKQEKEADIEILFCQLV